MRISKTRIVIFKILLRKLKNVRQKYDWQSTLENCASAFNNVAHLLQFCVFLPHFVDLADGTTIIRVHSYLKIQRAHSKP